MFHQSLKILRLAHHFKFSLKFGNNARESVKMFNKKNFSSMEKQKLSYLARSAHKIRIMKIKSVPFYLARRMCIIQ